MRTDDEIEIVRYGSGPAKVLVVPGLASAPSDFADLGNEMSDTHELHVVRNPWFAGQREWPEDPQSMDRKWQDGIWRLIGRLEPDEILGHSMGVFHVLRIMSETDETRKSIKRIVLMNPPGKTSVEIASPSNRHWSTDQGNPMVFAQLNVLNPTMTHQRFDAMRRAHDYEYGERVYKILAMAKALNIQPDDVVGCIRSLVHSTLVLTGQQDPMHDPSVIDRLAELNTRIRSTEITGGHHLHVSNPKGVAAIWKVWRKGDEATETENSIPASLQGFGTS